jgi:integrase
LLNFTDKQNLLELHYMLSLGVLTGARLETISTLEVRHIENAMPDPFTPGFCLVKVGPGTGVETKFDVNGELMVPAFLIDALKGYAYDMRRLGRQALAKEVNRARLFLTVRGRPYEPQSFNRLMTDLRRRAIANGLRFMGSFKFHQTRATYGTMMMELALEVADVKSAVAFVRDAMLHKDEVMTLRYVKFVQKTPICRSHFQTSLRVNARR